MPEDEEASDETSRHRGLVVMEITDQEAKKDLSGMTSDFQTAGENWKIRCTKNTLFQAQNCHYHFPVRV